MAGDEQHGAVGLTRHPLWFNSVPMRAAAILGLSNVSKAKDRFQAITGEE